MTRNANSCRCFGMRIPTDDAERQKQKVLWGSKHTTEVMMELDSKIHQLVTETMVGEIPKTLESFDDRYNFAYHMAVLAYVAGKQGDVGGWLHSAFSALPQALSFNYRALRYGEDAPCICSNVEYLCTLAQKVDYEDGARVFRHIYCPALGTTAYLTPNLRIPAPYFTMEGAVKDATRFMGKYLLR